MPNLSVMGHVRKYVERFTAKHEGMIGSHLELSFESIPASSEIAARRKFLADLQESAPFSERARDLREILDHCYAALTASDLDERDRSFREAILIYRSSTAFEEGERIRSAPRTWDQKVDANLNAAASALGWLLRWARDTGDGWANAEVPVHLGCALAHIIEAEEANLGARGWKPGDEI